MAFDGKGNYIDDCPACDLGGDTRDRIREAVPNATLSLGEDGMAITPDASNEQPVIPELEYDPDDVAFRSSGEDLVCVYISGPMTGDGTPEEMQRNVLAAWEIFKLLIERGFSPLCPHFSGLVPEHTDLTREEWVANDLHWVGRADAVLRLHGDSDGADDEVLHATHCGVPVFSTVEQLEEWRNGRLGAVGQ